MNFNIILIALLCLFTLLGGGCKKKISYEEAVFESSVKRLTEIATNSSDKDIRERANLALSYLQNDTVDMPVLIASFVDVPNSNSLQDIHILGLDDDRDLLGVGISEEIGEGDNSTVTEECFPIFELQSLDQYFATYWPIKFRQANEVQNDKEWTDYTLTENRELLPKVLISNPEDKDVKTSIWLYDKQGNKSNLVSLKFKSGIE